MNNLPELVAYQTQLAHELPLVHTSRCEHLSTLVSDAQLTPRLCPVFNENLVYLFYGRPAYRSNRGSHMGESVELCPICFVFKPHTVDGKVSRIFPCDTGAIKNGLFAPFLTETDLKNMELEPKIESARQLIPMFFETNQRYYEGRLRPTLTIATGGTAEKWHQLLLHPGPVGYDDRKSAIEVQVSEAIALTDQLLYVILPREFLDDADIREAILNVWRCDAIPYPTTVGAAPAEGYPIIKAKLEERLCQGTWL